jgi:hypothetical protein
MWTTVPLTPVQAEAARAVLAARLADPRHRHPRDVARLLSSLDPPPSVRAQAARGLRARLPTAERRERSELVAALRWVEPDHVDPDTVAADLADLRRWFSLSLASGVARADPDEATRREVLAALVDWATQRSTASAVELAQIEVVARDLGLIPPDLGAVMGTEAARSEPVRALARAARRACRGDEWRAFLAASAQ